MNTLFRLLMAMFGSSALVLGLLAGIFSSAAKAAPPTGDTVASGTMLAENACGEEDEWEDEEEEVDAFGGIAHTTFYMIEKVTLDPAAPKAGDKVKVSASLKLSSDEEENKVVSAKVFHRAGGNTTSADLTITMSGDEGEMATLNGEITAGAGKNQVWLSVKDMYGNVTTEGPALEGGFPSKADGLLVGGSDIDNAEDIVPDDMDLLDVKVGYDDKYFYSYFKVQGAISGGSIDPPNVNIYGTKVTNPDVDEGEGLLIGKILAALPLAKELLENEEIIKKIQEANVPIPFDKLKEGFGLLDLQKIMENPEEGFKIGIGEKVVRNGSEFYGAIPLEFFGEHPSGILRAISLGIANASIEALVPIPYNCTHFTQLYMRTHDFDA